MKEPVFRCRYRVIYGDTDAGGIVYYAHYLRFLEIGRTEFMRSLGIPYSGIEKEGYVLPVVESYVRYKASAKYDDLLSIETSLADLGSVSCRFHYRIAREGENRPLVLGFTVHAATDRDGNLVKIPDGMRRPLRQLIASSETK